ncbi:MAG TPA: DUF1003 domain-containing protein [Polyangiaceae bacterium]|jgi:uncharacterized membrane protein|nr:DUF1003 domain-containing protein [Polyangiaceae bacterium]
MKSVPHDSGSDSEGLIPCALCSALRRPDESIAVGGLRRALAEHIALHERTEWPADARICTTCMMKHKESLLMSQLEQERGELSELEHEVARRAANHKSIAAQLDQQFDRNLTLGQRVADAVARVGGSWPFVIGFCLALAVWVATNALALGNRAFDPYPFILLNLVLSCIAALQAPIIMMSQNRAAARDRMEADEDYKINLKAELEIAGLHEKIDHLLHVQWDRMVEIQVTQLELLNELMRERAESQRSKPH